jgi:hypothetical protein
MRPWAFDCAVQSTTRACEQGGESMVEAAERAAVLVIAE